MPERSAKIRIRNALRRWRRTACEIAGASWYSRPARDDLDKKLSRYLTKTGGLFIEAGANDGYSQSNTYYLEKMRGWSGLLVEPIPFLYEEAKRNRPRSIIYNCALVPLERAGLPVEVNYANLMSFVTGALGSSGAEAQHLRAAQQFDSTAGSYRFTVNGMSLSSLIDACGFETIDFLSLDVEGFEAPALSGLDMSRHRPEWICVEARFPKAIDDLLLGHYFAVEQLTDMDVLYRRLG